MGTVRRRMVLGILLAIWIVACAAPTPAPTASQPILRDYWPTSGWQTAELDSEGLDPAKLAGLSDEIAENLPFLHSLLIIRHGRLVHEEYFNGYDETSLHDVRSVTKSVISLLAGIAQKRGELGSPDARLVQAAPALFEGGRYKDKRSLTLRQLLMMRSGVQWDEVALYDEVMDRGMAVALQQDANERALSQPMGHKPGAWWSYSSLDTQLAAALLEGAAGRSLKDYAAEHLFTPLGIATFRWDTDAHGHTIGGGGLHLSARDMAKVGFLALSRGQWDGQEIVPADWIQLSTTPQGSGVHSDTGRTMPIEWYGYGWWTWSPRLFGGQRAIAAQGYGGQLIVLLPAYDLVVVTTADPDVVPAVSEQQTAAVYDMIMYRVLPAIADAPTTDPFWAVPDAPAPARGGLFAVKPDGKGQRALARDAEYGLWSPAWSPDGKQVAAVRVIPAVVRPGSAPAELHLYDADGAHVRQLTHNGRSNYLPAWSPDGERIAYISQGSTGQLSAEVCLISVAGGDEVCLTDNAAMEYGVSWSPDGSRLFFGTQRDGDWSIYTMNADGSDPRPLTQPAAGHTPVWSPDGKSIAFVSERSGNADIYVMEPTGANQYAIAAAPSADYMPAWSPEGRRIAFVSDRDGGTGVFVANLGGGNPRRVSATNVEAIAPSWSPDGQQILFAGTEIHTPSLFERLSMWLHGGR